MASGMTVRKDFAKLDSIIRGTPGQIEAFGRSVATEMTSDIVLSFGTSPSAPGDPPGVDTGALRSSIHWDPEGKTRWIIADGVIYGLHLELGTSKMAARPFVGPVFMEWRQRKLGAYAKSYGLIV